MPEAITKYTLKSLRACREAIVHRFSTLKQSTPSLRLSANTTTETLTSTSTSLRPARNAYSNENPCTGPLTFAKASVHAVRDRKTRTFCVRPSFFQATAETLTYFINNAFSSFASSGIIRPARIKRN